MTKDGGITIPATHGGDATDATYTTYDVPRTLCENCLAPLDFYEQGSEFCFGCEATARDIARADDLAAYYQRVSQQFRAQMLRIKQKARRRNRQSVSGGSVSGADQEVMEP